MGGKGKERDRERYKERGRERDKERERGAREKVGDNQVERSVITCLI